MPARTLKPGKESARADGKAAERMNGTRTTFCGHCRALRWVEDWNEGREEVLSIVLGPCGHVIERTARLEWSIPSRWRGTRGTLRLVEAASVGQHVATS